MHAFWWVLHHATPEDHIYLIHIYKVEVHSLAVTFVESDYRTLVGGHLRRNGEALLKRLSRKLKNRNIPRTMLLGEGEAKRKIPKKAEKLGVDMIVMGRRGMNKAKRLYVGSVSQYVVEHAPCAVCVVKEEVAKPKRTEQAGSRRTLAETQTELVMNHSNEESTP